MFREYFRCGITSQRDRRDGCFRGDAGKCAREIGPFRPGDERQEAASNFVNFRNTLNFARQGMPQIKTLRRFSGGAHRNREAGEGGGVALALENEIAAALARNVANF